MPRLRENADFFTAALGFKLTSDEGTKEFDSMMRENVMIDNKVEPRSDPNDPQTIAADTGRFEIRDAIGQQFSRGHKAGTPQGIEYAKCKGHNAKREFREAWAKATFEQYGKEGKRESKAWQDIDEELGEHMTLGAVVKLFGGWKWEPAITGAKRLAAACAKLGKPWITVDGMSGLTMYLVLRKRNRHLMKTSFELFEEHYSKQGPSDGGAATPTTVSGYDLDRRCWAREAKPLQHTRVPGVT